MEVEVDPFSQHYLIDSNIIRIFFNYYMPKDIFSDLWKGFDKLDKLGFISSVDAVKAEVCRQLPNNTAAMNWVQSHDKIFTQPTDEEISIFTEIVSHNEFQLTEKEINREKEPADVFLVSKGFASLKEVAFKYAVVSDETYASHGKKLPTMCERYGVQYYHRIEFLKILKKVSLMILSSKKFFQNISNFFFNHTSKFGHTFISFQLLYIITGKRQ